MQDEGEPFRGGERVEDDEQRHADGVGQHGFLFRVAAVLRGDGRVGEPYVERFLALPLARAQQVQAHPRHDRRQPPGDVLDVVGVGTAGAQPGFLERVIGLAHRAEHPVSHRPQMRPVLLETLCQPCALAHRVTFLPRGVSEE